MTKMKGKKFLHITAVRELGAGQRQQLIYEFIASKKLKELTDIQWDTLSYHSFEPVNCFERKTPEVFDFIIIRNLYFWIKVLKESRNYDIVLLRHIAFDPFSFMFAPFIKNRMSIHHSKEMEELPLVRAGWKGKFASWLEKYSGKCILKNNLGIIGVTQEIACYENQRIGFTKNTYVYPNGLDFNEQFIIGDSRDKDVIHIFFMCSYFSEWHGLDLLLNSLRDMEECSYNFYIHLIGNLSLEQINTIASSPYRENIISYGKLNKAEYIKIAEKCDVGVASLALFRQNLSEGSTLKVREMLAMGLPVFSGHKDVAFDDDFKFYTYSKKFKFEDLLQFGRLHKSTSRADVRRLSQTKLDKLNIMINFVEEIQAALDNN